MSFKIPEKYRDRRYSSPELDGNNGVFFVPGRRARDGLKIIASDGLGWEHVSVTKNYECPTWEEMCTVKDLFWDEEDCVVQFHPPRSKYKNQHVYCLHLWRKIGSEFETPDLLLV